jgi:hypothetical protein
VIPLPISIPALKTVAASTAVGRGGVDAALPLANARAKQCIEPRTSLHGDMTAAQLDARSEATELSPIRAPEAVMSLRHPIVGGSSQIGQPHREA